MWSVNTLEVDEMTELEIEVANLTKSWARKGGKKNRRLQRRRMLAFANHAASMGAIRMQQVGPRHALNFWKNNTTLAKTTTYNFWLAICQLWKLSGKPSKPPKPKTIEEESTHE
jgi:hypothetical protein